MALMGGVGPGPSLRSDPATRRCATEFTGQLQKTPEEMPSGTGLVILGGTLTPKDSPLIFDSEPPMTVRQFLCLLYISVLLLPQTVFAQADIDEEDFPPGVFARYTAGGKTVERIDPDIAFSWDGFAPDERLPAGPFEAHWSSTLLVKQEGNYLLSAFVQGDVTVTLDGKTVLSSSKKTPGWVIGKPFELNFGDIPVEVTFKKSAPAARVQLFWSSDKFSLEPIPANLFFREEGNPQLKKIARGKSLFNGHRCARCHVRQNANSDLPAPDLSYAQSGLSADWLIARLTNPKSTSAHSLMPGFGFSDSEAKSIAAFLLMNSQQAKLIKPKKPAAPKKGAKPLTREQETERGLVLLQSIGCLGCHKVGKTGNETAYSGGDLSNIGRKRSVDWLVTWLQNPKSLNADHRMPVIRLNDTERRQLAFALASLKSLPKVKSTGGDLDLFDNSLINAGRKLVQSARCAACHRIPGVKANLKGVPDLSKPVANFANSCLNEQPNRAKFRPAYKSIDRAAVAAYVTAYSGRFAPSSPFALGQHALERNNCLACHERDQSLGNKAIAGKVANQVEQLRGKSQGLIPPALTAVGDKLLDSVLRESVRGDQRKIRMPWLLVRMPKFHHSEQVTSDLMKYLIAHDRIPAGSPETIHLNTVAEPDSVNPQMLIAGHTLVGARGWSCIACHEAGSYVPKNVALGTHGSNLLMMGQRLRKEYFMRWCRAPLRIVPGMEMPSYVKAVPGILGNQSEAQLNAVWYSLNDSKFTVPTNPSVVEQLWAVKSGQPARVVRDVFTNLEENGGGAISRSMAIGLENGHNLLFDFDSASISQWTLGDLARQRTQGKSWYWDMAGVAIISGVTPGPDLVLRNMKKQGDTAIKPISEHGRVAVLKSYRKQNLGLEFNYTVRFEVGGQLKTVSITESIQPSPPARSNHQSAWLRKISAENIPTGFQLLAARPIPKTTFGSPRIDSVSAGNADWKSFPDLPGREFQPVQTVSKTSASILLIYSCQLQSEKSQLVPVKPNVEPKMNEIYSAPGFDGVKLPFTESIMPTAFTWLKDGTLAFTSLKGHVYLARDTNGDGIEDQLTLFEEGLSAPFGIIADGDDLIVSHKPEVIRLTDTDGDGRADVRQIVADGWGFNDNYHDWATGIVRDSQNNLYIGLGSDYAQPKRPRDQIRWRGKILKISPDGNVVPVGHDFRYPVGIAIDAQDRIFISDQQGVQNCFNEINYLIPGEYYGVPSQEELAKNYPGLPATVQVPHPWTRSVNGLFFLNQGDKELLGLAGHGIGCEFNGKLLIRYTTEEVNGKLQGATYQLTKPDFPQPDNNFLGPICGAVSPSGKIYVGSIYDSGWLGGRNTGEIVQLKPNGKLPNGIRELKATADGFQLVFFRKIHAKKAMETDDYSISGYTRVYGGGYATADSGRHKVNVKSVDVSADGKIVNLHVDGLKPGHVYEVTCGKIQLKTDGDLWPSTGHYTLNEIPKAKN